MNSEIYLTDAPASRISRIPFTEFPKPSFELCLVPAHSEAIISAHILQVILFLANVAYPEESRILTMYVVQYCRPS
jgi:hypothetical protein